MSKKKKVALLCDYGMDDAIATMYLFLYAEQFAGIDIVPVAGNFPLKQTFVNAKRILTQAEKLPEHLRIVDTSCIVQSEISIPEIHGKDGMGDLLPKDYEELAPVIAYDTWLEQMDEDYIIVSLGPCTVTADILKKKGALPLVLMGGNISEPPNYGAYEFNHGVDTESFAECVKYPHRIATLDTCHFPLCDLNRIELEVSGLLGDLLNRYKELSRERKEQVCGVYDMVAVVYLIHPERFGVEISEDNDKNRLSVLKYISDKPII